MRRVLVVIGSGCPRTRARRSAAELQTALELLAEQGYVGGHDRPQRRRPDLWVLATTWETSGAYRRALSAYDVKLRAVPLLGRALDEPSAYEVVEPGHRPRISVSTAPSITLSPVAKPPPPPSTRSSPSPSGGGSSTRAARSTAAPARPGTTARSASSSRRTSSASGGKSMVQMRDDVVGLDSGVILPRQVWEASGHVDTFTDPLTECQSCHKRFRADHLQEEYAEKKGLDDPDDVDLGDPACPNCGTRGAWTEPRQFSGLLKTYLGVIEDESGLHYLRPETAQGIFLNFANVVTSSRQKPPFGIAQIGKSFRNEITPGNFIFRTREFEQMEMEFFVKPGEDEEWHQYWIDERTHWYVDLGIDRGQPAPLRAPAGEAQPLLEAHRRHRVPLPLRRLGVGRARGHRQPHRLRPHHARQALGPGPVATSTRPPTSATCRTSSSRRPASPAA